jgi:CBS domain-containing protein
MSSATQPVITRPRSAQDLAALPVSAVMVSDVPVVDRHDPVVEVWQRLYNLDNPVAVVCEGTRVVAVVSQHTLAMWWPSGGPCQMRRCQVRDVIDPGIPTVHPHTTVGEAAGLINNYRLEGVPVVAASGALLGLVTPTELVRLLAEATTDDHPLHGDISC